MTSAQTLILILVIVVIAAGAILIFMRNRSRRLQTRFGPEYDRIVQETGSRFKAEAELEKREKRVERYPIRALSPVEADRFQESWRAIQARFVDDPMRAFTEADELLGQVMSARGYPVSDFEQRAEGISVDHGAVVEHYRVGHGIALRGQQNAATTEELRQGMIHYRALFDELVAQTEQLQSRAAGVN